jgi:hypothetical protein
VFFSSRTLPAGMLPAFGTAQRHRIDRGTAECLADRLHRPLHGAQECHAGVLHQVPVVGNLDRFRTADGGSLDIASTKVPRDDADRGPCGKPRGNGCCLAVGDKVDDATAFQIADDHAVVQAALERPVIDADHAGSLNR